MQVRYHAALLLLLCDYSAGLRHRRNANARRSLRVNDPVTSDSDIPQSSDVGSAWHDCIETLDNDIHLLETSPTEPSTEAERNAQNVLVVVEAKEHESVNAVNESLIFHDALDDVAWWDAILDEIHSDAFIEPVFMGAVHGVVRNLKFFIRTVTTVSVFYKNFSPLVAVMPIIEDLLNNVEETGVLHTNLIRTQVITRIPYYKFFGEALDVKDRAKSTRDESKRKRQAAYDTIQLALQRIRVRPQIVTLSERFPMLDRVASTLQRLFNMQPVLYTLFDHFLYFSMFAQEEIGDWLEPEKVAGKAVREMGLAALDQVKSNPSIDAFLLRVASILKRIK